MADVKTICITLPILGLNNLIDSGSSVSIDEMHQMIDAGTVFEDIQERFGHIQGFEFLLEQNNLEHKQEISEALQRMANAYAASDFQVENNGLNYLLGMLNELLQQGSKVTHIR